MVSIRKGPWERRHGMNISPCTCTYSALLICAIHTSSLPCLESLAPRPNPPLSLVHLVAPELAKLLIISISLCPTLKGSLLFYFDCLWHSRNRQWYGNGAQLPWLGGPGGYIGVICTIGWRLWVTGFVSEVCWGFVMQASQTVEEREQRVLPSRM